MYFDYLRLDSEGSVLCVCVCFSFMNIVMYDIVSHCRVLAGLPVLILIIGFVIWSGAKVAFAFICEEHLWNLTTGCVKRMHG